MLGGGTKLFIAVMRALRFLAVVPLALVFACGGKEFTAVGGGGAAGSEIAGSGGGAGSGGAGQGGAGAGGSRAGSGGTGATVGAGGGHAQNSGDCDTDADCGGDPCVEISPGGYRVCETKVPLATTCSSPAGECCKTADCAAAGKQGKCLLGPVAPSCGGPALVPTNVCAIDKCTSASGCSGSNGVCVPAGVFGRKVASCMTGGCRRDSECSEGKGGACVPVSGACCPGPVGLYCVYQGGCVNDGDCTNGHCDVSSGKAVCAPGGVACAASL